jgi:Leucine-rich repeat (LRR) protein
MKRRFIFKFAVTWTVFAVQTISAQTAGRYNLGDIAVINDIIENNGLKWTKAELADGSFVPMDWEGVKWSDDDTNMHIVNLNIQSHFSLDDQEEGTLSGMLNVSALSYLQYLDCSINKLTSINISGLTRLHSLRCNDNQLTFINLSGCINLQTLNCSDNNLSSLEVSELTSLRELHCGWNSLTFLDVSGLTNLYTLICSENSLSMLNVSGCTRLQSISCRDNSLTALDVLECTNLAELNCDNNNLTALNLAKCINLATLWCQNNNLTSLDLTGIDYLTVFFGKGQTCMLTLTGSDNNYSTRIIFGNGTTFENTALTYNDGILKSENSQTLISEFFSPAGLMNFGLSGTLTLNYIRTQEN